MLAFRRTHLASELGLPDLYSESASAAILAGKGLLSVAIDSIGKTEKSTGAERSLRTGRVIQDLVQAKAELPAWLLVAIMPRTQFWLSELDETMELGDNAMLAQLIIPPFLDLLSLPDAQERKERLAQRAVRVLMKSRKFTKALELLQNSPDAKSKLAAECYEESGQLPKAAALYLELGDKEKALRLYRSIPDFKSAFELVRKMPGHSAQASLEWIADLNKLIERRPENFNRVMLASEKKLLEEMFERGMGVKRKKPAARKTATKKQATKKAPAKKRAPLKRTYREDPF
jgi:tetratricopeptide (TPR) repeat protein